MRYPLNVFRTTLFLILLLAACESDVPTPERLDFGDPRILRGAWAGEVASAPVVPLAYSPDGSKLFSVKAFDTAVYDTRTFEVIARLELGEGEFVDTAQFDVDGEVVATTAKEDDQNRLAVSLWDARTGERLQDVSFEGSFVAFSADLERLAVSTFLERSAIEIWDVRSRSLLTSLDVPRGFVDLTLNADLTEMALLEEAYSRYVLTLQDTETKRVRLEQPVSKEDYAEGALRFSPDASLLALTSGFANYNEPRTVDLLDTATGEFLASPGRTLGTIFAFSADSERFVTHSGCGACLRIWNARSGALLEEVTLETPGNLEDFAYGFLLQPQLDQAAWRGLEEQLVVSDLGSGDVLARVAPMEPLDIGLTLDAAYVDESSYEVSGTLQYDGETYSVRGKVFGSSEQSYLKPATSYPDPNAWFILEALEEGEVRWILQGAPPRKGENETGLDENSFEGTAQLPTTSYPSRTFRLTRQP